METEGAAMRLTSEQVLAVITVKPIARYEIARTLGVKTDDLKDYLLELLFAGEIQRVKRGWWQLMGRKVYDKTLALCEKKATCHPDKKHVGKGLCKKCYNNQHRAANRLKALEQKKRLAGVEVYKVFRLNQTDLPAKCCPHKKIFSRGLCTAHYLKIWRTERILKENRMAA